MGPTASSRVISVHCMRQSIRDALYVIIFEAETPLGQAFDILLLLLILASVVSTSLETV